MGDNARKTAERLAGRRRPTVSECSMTVRLKTQLESAIRRQPDELERLIESDVAGAAVKLERCDRVAVVGTGTSQHAAELGAGLLQESGIDARAYSSIQFALSTPPLGPTDGVIIVCHSARTAFAVAARARALSSAGATVSITRVGGGWAEAIETVAAERSHTYSVSFTSALVVLGRLAQALGASTVTADRFAAVVARARDVVAEWRHPELPSDRRLTVLAGLGPAATSAREGALKLREAARTLAEGYEAEYLLHSNAVPLTDRDVLLTLHPSADSCGLLTALGQAASREGLKVRDVDENTIGHPVLAQIPIVMQLQILAHEQAQLRGHDPDLVIAGGWADRTMWSIGGVL